MAQTIAELILSNEPISNLPEKKVRQAVARVVVKKALEQRLIRISEYTRDAW